MVKIENTDLDIDETEGKILDYFLGGVTEDKEQWAKRVWDCCRLYSEGKEISRVYATKQGQTWQERANELWNNKKKKRKEAIKRQFRIKEKDLSDIDKHSMYKKRKHREEENG